MKDKGALVFREQGSLRSNLINSLDLSAGTDRGKDRIWTELTIFPLVNFQREKNIWGLASCVPASASIEQVG